MKFACPKPHLKMDIPHLTLREREVLHLLCSDACWLEKEMPALLKMSLSTFKTHKENLFRIFKVHTRFELQVKAIKLGLVPCHCGNRGEGSHRPGMIDLELPQGSGPSMPEGE